MLRVALIIMVLMNGVWIIFTGETISCFPNRPCKIPLVTHNPAILICLNGPVQDPGLAWFYSNTSEPVSRALKLVGDRAHTATRKPLQDLQLRSELQGSDLLIRSPTVYDSGVYVCKVGDKILAYYEVDMQDIAHLHVSGSSVGVSPLPRRYVEVGKEKVELFTVWNEWEECDRCGFPGERRRLGYCYARLRNAAGEPVPCGLMVLAGKQRPPSRGPELSLEPCDVPCATDSAYGAQPRRVELPGRHFVLLNESRVLLFETYLVNIHGNVTFQCPEASIYTPVSWQRNFTVVTRLELSKHPLGTHSLDKDTSGGTYTIRDAQVSDQGVYRCFVSDKLAGSFHLRVIDPFRKHKAVTSSAMGLIWYTLAFIAALSVLLVFLTCLYTYCSQTRRHQIVQW